MPSRVDRGCLPDYFLPILGPYVIAGNFSVDLAGKPDKRRDTWGRAGVQMHVLTFSPPKGYLVRILGILGDQLLWPTLGWKGPAIVPEGRYMAALGGIHRTLSKKPIVDADFAADDHFVFVQHGTNGPVSRAPFDVVLTGVENTLLREDHQLHFKQAVWLNDTGLMAHMEITFSTLEYQFERQYE